MCVLIVIPGRSVSSFWTHQQGRGVGVGIEEVREK